MCCIRFKFLCTLLSASTLDNVTFSRAVFVALDRLEASLRYKGRRVLTSCLHLTTIYVDTFSPDCFRSDLQTSEKIHLSLDAVYTLNSPPRPIWLI